MTAFEGFREGCPAEVQLGKHPYIHAVIHFQAEGRELTPDDAGSVIPDAIRIARVDDYMASTYQDKVLAFEVDAAEDQVARDDPKVSLKNTRLLYDEQIERLNRACESCHRALGEACPVLRAAIDEFERTNPPMTLKEAYIAELNWFIAEFGDSRAAIFQIHRPPPTGLSEEDLQDVAALVAEQGWNASIEPLEHEGETVMGIRIIGGDSHKQSED
jgi:hypothetical protein